MLRRILKPLFPELDMLIDRLLSLHPACVYLKEDALPTELVLCVNDNKVTHFPLTLHCNAHFVAMTKDTQMPSRMA